MNVTRLRTRGPVAMMAAGAVGIAAVAFASISFGATAGGWSVALPWAPTLGLRIDLALDGHAALYALLATGIGVLVFAFATAYLPLHLAHEERPAADGRRFWPWMVLFMGAMVGLAMARDLVLIFILFDLTAVASYFLIGFDRHRAEARGAAFMALLVTGVSAVAMLLGAVLLYHEYGTFSLTDLFGQAQPSGQTSLACVLIATAALAKSAQVPLHFWLPRAMAAPTPVSAYLHSAAMVAAGVLVLGRIHPLLALDPAILDGLLVVGFASIAVGGLLALAHDELKQILAHSTISQYGYVVVLYGIGGAEGAGGAALYVIAHAVAKSALFMTAGCITEATGESRLSRLGGLGRERPLLAVASGIVAASLAALPLTLGFFKDELFFAAALAHGPAVAGLAVGAAALTVAYIGRFWLGLFTGPLRTSSRDEAARRMPPLLLGPVVVLAAVSLAGGVAVEPFVRLVEGAAAVTHGAAVDVAPAYHLDGRAENVMALAAIALGGLVLLGGRSRDRIAAAAAAAGDIVGPRRVYAELLYGLNRLSLIAHTAEVRDLRTSLAAVLVPTGALVALGLLATPSGTYEAGTVSLADVPLVALLTLAVVAGLTAARDPGRLRPVLALSVLGFALAGMYAVMGAPDVALVAVVIETVLTLVFVAVFARLPGTTVGDRGRTALARRGLRNVAAGIVAGVSAFAVIWAALSRPPLGPSDSAEQIRLTPEAHGGDVVTVILADFRGLDTMVEITVLSVAAAGVVMLLRRGSAS